MKSPPAMVADHILAQIAEIDRQLIELAQDKRHFERLLIRARRQDIALREVTRKNSLGRILAEKTILDNLANATENGTPSNKLWQKVRAADPSIKPTTFRSYLHRLKKRGLIQPNTKRPGTWKLPDKANASVERSKLS